jgi:hypothetical protein
MAKDRKYATTMLDKLVQLDKETQTAYYEMGRILHSIRQDKLYDILGYESFAQLVKEELSYSLTTAIKYAATYQRFRGLKYNKNEAIQLINEFGFTHMAKILPTMKNKLSKRAVKKRVDDLDEFQLNFSLKGDDYTTVLGVFESHGLMYSDNGRMMNSSEVFLDIIREAKAPKKAA